MSRLYIVFHKIYKSRNVYTSLGGQDGFQEINGISDNASKEAKERTTSR